MTLASSVIVPLVLGLLIAGIIFAALAGKSLPLIATPSAALIAVLVLGLAMCTGGIGQVGASGRWASPLAILGYLLGALILLVIFAGLFGWNLPLVHTPLQALAAAGALIAVKYAIGLAGYVFHLL